jgi:Tol biopolymer transport system component/Flp pilus assembly protein TadD
MTSDSTLIEASLFPRLIVKTGGRVLREIELRSELSIGRAEDNDLQLPDPKASRHHAQLIPEGGAFVLTDLGSANGTRVNGLRITEPHRLAHGDRIAIGDTELTFQEPGRSEQDTVSMEAAAAAVPAARPPAPSLEAPAPSEKGVSRGLLLGLILAAAVLVVGIVVIIILMLRPAQPVSPTATAMAANVTASTSIVTSAVTPGPTLVTATPGTTGVDPQEMNNLLSQGDALTRRSKFEDAIAIYEDLVTRAPDDARPEIGWAWALVLDEHSTDALAHAQHAVELDPLSSAAAAVLARVYVELEDKTQALTWAQKAVELGAADAEAHAVLAEAYLLNGEMQQAVDEADLALVQDINNADAHRIRGWLYYAVDNDMGRAASELQIAAGLQPELWSRRHELGELLLDAEDYVTAIMAFQDALAIRPKAVTYTAIGEAYYELGQYDQARASLQQAITAGAEDVDTYALLGASYAQLGRCDEARNYYEQALSLDSAHALALEAQALCQKGGPSPTPSATTVSVVEPTPVSTIAATPQPTKASAPAGNRGQIAFPVWNASKGKYDTYLANVDGTSRRLVAEEMHQPALRPDGSYLALNGERKSFEYLCLVKSNGSDLREITTHTEDGQPNWSPDGKKLVFASTQAGDKRYRIYLLDDIPYGGGKVEGRTLSYGQDDVRGQMPAWTADDRIVYRGCDLESPARDCNGTGLYIMSAAPGAHNPKRLTQQPGDTAPAVYGGTIAFMSNRDGNWEIYTMNLDGSGLRRLTNNAALDGLPVWSPDGKTIAFVSDQGGAWAVWAMSPTGSNLRKLFAIGGGGLAFDWQHERISWGQ